MSEAAAVDRPVSLPGSGAFSFPLRDARHPALTLLAIIAGAFVAISPATRPWAATIWFVALVALGSPLVLRTLRGIARGLFAADIVAMLAIVTAVALREPFAGLIIVLMQSGGELLERFAEGRASHAVRALEAAAPRVAHRLVAGRSQAEAEDVPAESVAVDDRLLIRPGEMVPCDGTVEEGTSSLDTSRLTGESLPERVVVGSVVRSGVVNREGPFVIRVLAPARESLYAQIVELVRTAQAQKAPIQRLADRWAIWFTPVTLVACALAWWLSADATRVLAVLVVATPCPLLLATPIAVIGGINRAARRMIIVRNGGALELLARVDTAVFDKTGTLTFGRPAVDDPRPAAGADVNELLATAASLEVGSGHPLARPIVDAASERSITMPVATDVVEHSGQGVSGIVNGARATVGSLSLVRREHPSVEKALDEAHRESQGLRAYVASGNRLLGTIRFADRPREGISDLFSRLRALGISEIVLLSGDHTEHVAPVARALGIDDARGDLLPQQKVEAVREIEARGGRVVMIGDGTNDAPALSAATVGIALAAHGGGISAEAAGVVLLADDLTRVGDAVAIGQSSVRIARQSIGVGLALSMIAMVAAAFGHIPPTIGALLQEGIDVAVILNALRAAQS